MKSWEYATCEEQLRFVKSAIRANQQLMTVLERLQTMQLPSWYVAGGSVAQTIWNHLSGLESTFGIKDYDVPYFDPDYSYEAEDAYIKQANAIFAGTNIPVELRNQARVHIWYPQKFKIEMQPFVCTEQPIASWLCTAASLAVKLNDQGEMEVFAPHGLSDVLSFTIRPNRNRAEQQINYETKALQWKQRWPNLTILAWQEDVKKLG